MRKIDDFKDNLKNKNDPKMKGTTKIIMTSNYKLLLYTMSYTMINFPYHIKTVYFILYPLSGLILPIILCRTRGGCHTNYPACQVVTVMTDYMPHATGHWVLQILK